MRCSALRCVVSVSMCSAVRECDVTGLRPCHAMHDKTFLPTYLLTGVADEGCVGGVKDDDRTLLACVRHQRLQLRPGGICWGWLVCEHETDRRTRRRGWLVRGCTDLVEATPVGLLGEQK